MHHFIYFTITKAECIIELTPDRICQDYIMQNTATEQDVENMFSELGITSKDDKAELLKVLTGYLSYPSDSLAECHELANRLGCYDQYSKRQELKDSYMTHSELPEICPCCCCLRQQDLLFRTDLKDIETLGQATALFFVNVKYAWIGMLICFVVYGAYAFITNIISAQSLCTDLVQCTLSRIALGSKVSNISNDLGLYLAQAWLGVALSFCWLLFFIYKAGLERKIQIEQDLNNPTASDFTVMIENMPKRYTQAQLQALLDIYAETVSDQIETPDESLYPEAKYDRKFTITTFNQGRPYYKIVNDMSKQQPSKLQLKLKDLKEELIKIIHRKMVSSHDSPTKKQQRNKVYLMYEDCRHQLQKQRKQKLKQIQAQCDIMQSHEKTKVVFVTFNHSFARMNLCNLNKSCFERICLCGKKGTSFKLEGATITRAPEPQDIIWENIGLKGCERFLRKTLTYVGSIVILGISFVIIYGLSKAQYESNSRALSFAISIFITIVNGLLAYIIRKLTILQKDFRATFQQISLTVKTVIAQLINSIVLSMIANHYIKHNIYEANGLVEDVFYFSITNAILPPLLKVFDVFYYWHLIMKCTTRKPENKLRVESQLDYNKVWERPEFEVGYEYAYVLKTCLYTAFYVSLQPIIALLAVFGLLLMYYAEKYVLFYRSSRPRPSSDLLNSYLNNILYFCICAYALGSLTWTNFLKNQQSVLVPNLISLGIGILIYLLPFQALIDCIKKEEHRPIAYQTQRLFFVSQYDRLNPHTRQEGIINFYQYLSDRKQSYLNEIVKRNAIALNPTDTKPENLFLFASRIVADRGHLPNVYKSRSLLPSPRIQPGDISQLELRKRQTGDHHSKISAFPNDLMRMAVNNMPNMHLMPRLAESTFRPLRHLHQEINEPNQLIRRISSRPQ